MSIKKTASIEKTLSQLAESQLMQTMPSLQDSVIGFQIINANDEKNEATGMFIAKIGDTCIFIPAMYRNGKMYAMDMMYLPEVNQFLPARDNWVSYLKSRKADFLATLGSRMGNGGSFQRGMASSVSLKLPFSRMAKFASADLDTIKADDLMGLVKLAADDFMADGIKAMDEHTEIFPGGLRGYLPLFGRSVVGGLIKMAGNYPKTGNSLLRYYSPDDLSAVAEQLDAETTIGNEIKKEKQGEVKVVTSKSKEAAGLSDDQKSEVLKDGVIITDTRGIQHSKVYRMEQSDCWVTPDKTGTYSMLCADGSTFLAFVIVPPVERHPWELSANQVTNGSDASVHFKSTNQAYLIPLKDTDAEKGDKFAYHIRNELVAAPIPEGAIQLEAGWKFTDLPEIRGRIDHRAKDERGHMHDRKVLIVSGKEAVVVYVDKMAKMLSGEMKMFGPLGDNAYCCYPTGEASPANVNYLVQIPESGKLKQVGDKMMVPEGSNIYILGELSDYRGKALATRGDFLDVLVNGALAEKLKIHNANGTYAIWSDSGEKLNMSKTAAMLELVKSHGVEPSEAKLLLMDLDGQENTKRFVVKKASDFYEPMGTESVNVADVPESVVSQEAVPYAEFTDSDRMAIDRAAQSGVQEVFDTSMLKVLSGKAPSVRLLGEYSPDLFKALDRICRILYMFRSGNTLSEAFGTSRAEEMETTMGGLIVDLGDFIMYLQQGKIGTTSDLLEGSLTN